jgi:hypothetical protein
MQSSLAAWLLVGVLALGACASRAQPSDGLSFTAEVTPEPARVGPTRIAVRLRGPAGEPFDGASLALEGNMSHPGMVPVLGSLRGTGEGVYTGTLMLNMAGDWFVRVHGTLPGGAPFERTFALPGVKNAR